MQKTTKTRCEKTPSPLASLGYMPISYRADAAARAAYYEVLGDTTSPPHDNKEHRKRKELNRRSGKHSTVSTLCTRAQQTGGCCSPLLQQVETRRDRGVEMRGRSTCRVDCAP